MTGAPPGRFRFGRALLGFLAGLVLGYAAILFGWVAFATPDRTSSGGDIMAIGFVVAPMGSLVLAAVGAIWFGRARTTKP